MAEQPASWQEFLQAYKDYLTDAEAALESGGTVSRPGLEPPEEPLTIEDYQDLAALIERNQQLVAKLQVSLTELGRAITSLEEKRQAGQTYRQSASLHRR